MKRWSFFAAGAALALLGGPGMGEWAWGLSRQDLGFAWPLLSRQDFWVLGALLGLAWMLSQALAWKLAFDLRWDQGALAGALGAGLGAAGWLWPFLARPVMPYPHHLAERTLQIFGAGLGLGAAALSLALGLWFCAQGPWRWWQIGRAHV